MKIFDKQLIDDLRKICHLVYVDEETPEKYIGKLKGYDGDRVRIFVGDWEYEEATICYSDGDLRAVLRELLAEEIEIAESCGMTFEEYCDMFFGGALKYDY